MNVMNIGGGIYEEKGFIGYDQKFREIILYSFYFNDFGG